MKYANLYWQNTELPGGEAKAVNIGDNLQFMAIDYLYSQFLPDKECTVKLQMKEVKEYRGELLILPLNWSLFDIHYMEEERIAISEDIIPVFLAATIESGTFRKEYFNEYNISYLKRYEPIGCRDAHTMDVLQDYGIKAYLNGCMSAALPRRENSKGADKIFFVDVPTGVEKYIPADIKKNCEIMSQQYYYASDISIPEIIEDIREQYRKYAREAGLVVTSRLHVASPCMAMGIPVILVKDEIDARFGWIDKYLPLYNENSYDRIDWFPDPIEYEEEKKQLINHAIWQIQGVYDRYKSITEINLLYDYRRKRDYAGFQETLHGNLKKACLFLQNHYKPIDEFTYSIWGCTEAAEKFYDYMCGEFPKARLKNIIDAFKKTEFHGIRTVEPENFSISEEEIVFILPAKASSAAKKFFKEKGIDENRYVCCGSLFME